MNIFSLSVGPLVKRCQRSPTMKRGDKQRSSRSYKFSSHSSNKRLRVRGRLEQPRLLNLPGENLSGKGYPDYNSPLIYLLGYCWQCYLNLHIIQQYISRVYEDRTENLFSQYFSPLYFITVLTIEQEKACELY